MIDYVDDRPGHDFRYALDISKIQHEIKWSPKVTFNKGIEMTIDWYLENKSWWENLIEN